MRRVFLRLVTSLVLGSWTLGALLAAAPSKNDPKNLDHKIPADSVPVRILGGFLVVAEGQFGDVLKHQNFILDTGTSPSILNLRIAKQLRLDLSPGRLAAIGRESEVASTVVPELELGGLQAKDAHFLTTDLADLERTWKVAIAGILGMDILGRASFRLDYGNKVLEFGQVREEGIPIGLSTPLNLPIAEVKINGKHLHLLVDTGSDHLVFFGKHWDTEFSFNTGGSSLSGTSVAGAVAVRALPSLELEWNGERFQQQAVVVAGTEQPFFDGLLSVRAMGFRSIAVDANTHVVYLRK